MSAKSGAIRPEVGLVEYHMAALIFYCLLFIIGVTVNLTALWVFALTTKKRSSVTVYMINVAVVDLLFILLLPFRMVYHHSHYWPFGDIFCRISAALTIFYPSMALWLFALISADRHMAIVQPKHGKELRNVPKTVAACLGLLLMTLGANVTLLFTKDDPDVTSNFTTCIKMHDIHQIKDNNMITFVRLIFFFLVPVCIMIVSYIIIVNNLIHGRASKLKPKVKQKSIRIIITLIIQILVCFVPFHVCLVLSLLWTGSNHEFSTWAIFTTFLMNLSTVLDIILYYIVSKQFQDRVISVILYRNYLRSVRRKSRCTHTGSIRSMSNLNSTMI